MDSWGGPNTKRPPKLEYAKPPTEQLNWKYRPPISRGGGDMRALDKTGIQQLDISLMLKGA